MSILRTASKNGAKGWDIDCDNVDEHFSHAPAKMQTSYQTHITLVKLVWEGGAQSPTDSS